MATRTLVSVEEYLATSYRPDCDYVDGKVVERNWERATMVGSNLPSRRIFLIGDVNGT